MKPAILGPILINCTAFLALTQSTESPPKFEAADVHVSAKVQNQFVRTGPVRGGRYEIKFATMVDLVRLAYDFNNDRILGGPSWLEMDRFDVVAKVPPDSTPDSLKPMLQSLLEDRFKLVIHKETRPLPAYALVAGKKPQLKEADGAEDSGCKPQSQSAAGADGARTIRMGGMVAGGGGGPVSFTIGSDGTIQYACRNITMEAFVSGLPRMMGATQAFSAAPVSDETGLKGKWNFDVRWSIGFFPIGANEARQITVFDAVEKQLGLKLEERQVPTPVIVVDSVNQKPSDNPPGTADALPVIPTPTEFDVASVKSSQPGDKPNFRTMARERFEVTAMPMRFLLMQAFNMMHEEQVVGIPGWADTETFDINAKAPPGGASSPGMDPDYLAPMLRSLLADRFKMTWHTEERQLPAFSLSAVKPKMKKADPASRAYCRVNRQPAGLPVGTQVYTCQNITMAQFAERLERMSPEVFWPVADATGLDGGWDFTLTFSLNFGMRMMARGGDPGASASGAGPAAPPDPSGGISILDAIEKQLGLKLEKQKRAQPVIVIDHLEQKPTEN